MKEYKFSYKGKLLKKKLKNKPLQKIKESNLDFIFMELDSEYVFKLQTNCILQPASRPRSGCGKVYDPLSSYKKHIIKQIEEMIKKYKLDEKYEFPIIGEIHSLIKIYKKPPKSWSMIKRYNAIKNNIVYDSFPDLDNVEKTAWDMFSDANIIWNDKAVNKTNSSKYYGEEDKTEIIISIKPFKDLYKNKLNKEEINYIKNLYNGE